jgi:catalase (peroxidase I)
MPIAQQPCAESGTLNMYTADKWHNIDVAAWNKVMNLDRFDLA